MVNGQKVGRHELKSGDVIRVGDTELRFEADLTNDATLPPQGAAPERPAAVFAKKAGQRGMVPPALKALYDLEGKPFGRYQLQRVVGAGTLGVVFEVPTPATGRLSP